tara:strand:- start:171 stop:362 length:192 start_codon:yes stop_codon:yes gene_type:complete
MNIEIYYKSNYGRDLCYPVCDVARNACKLTGTKTLSNYHLKVLKDMGYKLSVLPYIPSYREVS